MALTACCKLLHYQLFCDIFVKWKMLWWCIALHYIITESLSNDRNHVKCRQLPRCDKYGRICFTAEPSRPGLSRWYGTLAITVARHFNICVVTSAEDSDDRTISRHRCTALTIRPTTTDNGVNAVRRYWSLRQNNQHPLFTIIIVVVSGMQL